MNFRELRFSGKSVWIECDNNNLQVRNGYTIETVADKYLLTHHKQEISFYNSFADAVHAAIEHKNLNV